jgi:CHAT domain-containing protein/tetratricopeptide (TPR) repeat protein
MTGIPVWANRLGALVLIVAVSYSATCRPRPDLSDVTELDGELLLAVTRLVAPLPMFMGSASNGRDLEIFAGGACPPALRRPAHLETLDPAERARLRSIGLAVARFGRRRPSDPAVLRLNALWSLLTKPSPEGRNRVVTLLQDTLASAPASVARRNDLAAAHLLRATVDGRIEAFAAALELLDRAAMEPHPPDEALFNRGYALQCLTLWDDAAASWWRMSAVEPRRGSDRAAGNQPVPRAARDAENDPLRLRHRGEWLLGEWASRSLDGNFATARSSLLEAEGIGSRLQATGGGQLLRAAVDTIRQVERDGDSRRLGKLVKGHAEFHSVRGTEIYSQCLPAVLRSAEAALASGGSSFVGWVQLDQAVCAYYETNYRRAEAILAGLRPGVRIPSDAALGGRAEWMLGLVRMLQARFGEADAHYARAIALFSHVGERGHVVYLRSLRARNLEYAGAREAAWRERLAALAERQAVDDPERLFTVFGEATQTLRSQGFPEASLGFLSEQMRAAEAVVTRNGKSDWLGYTLLARASLLADLGRRSEAVSDLEHAESVWSRLPVASVSRRRLRVQIDVQHAMLDPRSDLAASLAAVDRAAAYYSGSPGALGDQVELLKMYQLRAKVHLRWQEFEAAREDLRQGIAEVERQRFEVATLDDRARFLSQWRSLLLDLVRLELDHFADPLAALDALERSSNRVLGDAADGGRSDGGGTWRWQPRELYRSMPAGALLVRFGHLADRLLVWTFRGGRARFEQHPLPEGELSRKVGLCRDSLATAGSSRAGRESACNTLTQALLPRELHELPDSSAVLLAPDDLLEQLPFAALRLTPDGPYLVERFKLSYVPSIALWTHAGGAADGTARHAFRSALFVSDPAFSTDLYPELNRLPASREGAASCAAHYARATILSDRHATIAAVLAQLPTVELFQFDGHGIANPQYPERGGLLLAPGDAKPPDLESTVLTAAALSPQTLRGLRLVVLGACSTGLAVYRDSAETTGLAASFLARGVPEVVAAAWNIPDTAAAQLLVRFHGKLALGESTDEALRAAQLGLLQSPDGALADPSSWAAFQLFRGAH